MNSTNLLHSNDEVKVQQICKMSKDGWILLRPPLPHQVAGGNYIVVEDDSAVHVTMRYGYVWFKFAPREQATQCGGERDPDVWGTFITNSGADPNQI